MKVIEVGNKEYEIKFTINTLCRMEADGLRVMKLEEIIDNISFTMIRKLFFYGLKDSVGKSLTENKAGDMMDEYLQENDYNELMTVLIGELAKSLGYDIDEKLEQNKNEEAGE